MSSFNIAPSGNNQTTEFSISPNTILYHTVESSILNTLVANMCPDYRGVINSGVKLYHKAQFGALVIQGSPHFRVFSIEGFHCIIILMVK